MNASAISMSKQRGIALLTTVLLLLLMSSMLVGFIVLVNSSQRLNSNNNDYGRAFYGAEAGMEKMTADLGNLFDANYSPSGTQIQAITTTPPPVSGVNYIKGDGTSGYSITYPGFPGNPTATNATIKSGPYQGMTALATPYTLLVNARTVNGAEVKLQRTTQTVGIPMFQFGIFSDADLSFFPGPPFSFGGRTHTNGNLFLASGNTLTMSDRVTAVKNVIRTNLSNGFPTTTGSYNGTVNITTSPGTSSYRPLAYSEGSLVGTIGSGANPVWNSVSLGATNYAGNLRSGSTGATQLNLGIVLLGGGTTQPVDLIRRPVAGEAMAVTSERYYFQASFRVLLSDNPIDITSLPCVSAGAPFDLSTIAAPVANWPTTGYAAALLTRMNTNNTAGYSTLPVPLAASGAVQGRTTYTVGDHNGYWVGNPTAGTANPFTLNGNFSSSSGFPLIRGFIKIEIQTAYGTTSCGTWQDVTQEVLAYGYAGKNINTYGGLSGAVNDAYPASTTANSQVGPGYSSTGVNPPLLALPTTQLPFQNASTSCPDVHPNAIIRLERVRDNPSTWSSTNACGVTVSGGKVTVAPTHPTDYWPNALFDTREGTLRDVNPTGSLASGTASSVSYNAINYSNMVNLGGVMNYVEIDMKNLTRYLSGGLPGSGHLAYDSSTAPNDYTVYVSDRRGNYTASPITASWPPNSPTQTETGEYGFQDIVNPNNAAGCMNASLDTGEDIDGLGAAPFVYGQNPTRAMAAGTTNPTLLSYGQYGTMTQASLYGTTNTTAAFAQYASCSAPTANAIWPMAYVVHANEARENPNFFFRRAVKLVNGSDLSALGNLPQRGRLRTQPCRGKPCLYSR